MAPASAPRAGTTSPASTSLSPSSSICTQAPVSPVPTPAHDTHADAPARLALNISVANINIRTQKGSKQTDVLCDPATLVAGEQATLGFQCANGPFVATPV